MNTKKDHASRDLIAMALTVNAVEEIFADRATAICETVHLSWLHVLAGETFGSQREDPESP